VSDESDWTARWAPGGPKVAWRRNVGRGASSFVVVDDRVITMGNRADTDIVWCLDASSGRVIWRFNYPCKFDDRNFEGGTASTPTVEGSSVFTLAYDGQVHCLDVQHGQLAWRKHLVRDFGGRYSSWKYAGSPLVTGDMVIFDTGADGNSTVALEKTSGRKVWGAGHDLAGYATPIPFTHDGQRGVLIFKARAMVAHGLSDGHQLWRLDWRTNYDVNASTPTVVGDKLFISSGYGGRRARGALFQLGQVKPRQIWVNDDLETKMSSAVVYEDHVYCVSERSGGQLMCVDLRRGNTVWAERSFAPYGTLMIAEGKLVVLDEEGELVIADAAPAGYRELARAKVLDGRCWAMPVLANGRIYARTNTGEMVCVDVRAASRE
jgi:outer membrane protein assembly factor BamB